MAKTVTREWESFEDFFMKVLKTPYAEIKAKLNEEKAAKKRKKSKKSSASREAI